MLPVWQFELWSLFMSKTILVVDDQTSLRQMLRFALNLNGLEVVEAENGLDALEKLEREAIDLIIVDWQMPVVDGLELVRRLRKMDSYQDLPIVFISCMDNIEARREAGSLGVLTWLKKPFRMSEIQSVVEGGLGISPVPEVLKSKRDLSGYC